MYCILTLSTNTKILTEYLINLKHHGVGHVLVQLDVAGGDDEVVEELLVSRETDSGTRTATAGWLYQAFL